MSEIDVNQVLQQMRQMSQLAQGKPPTTESVSATGQFGNLLENAIDRTNNIAQKSAQLAESFEMGDPSVNLSDVMVQMQKASVSFQAMTQVRNKLISAYQDVMNMQV